MNIDIKALILYWSATGNTEKIAQKISDCLLKHGIHPVVKRITASGDDELLDFDLVFLGSPSYQFLPPEPVQSFIKQKMKIHNERGDIIPGSPKRPGKKAVVFCTYSGPHTGISEAIPAGEYMGQLFDHLGFEVAGKWYTVGEFHNRLDMSTSGRLGDIRGRPHQQDLLEIENKLKQLLESM